MPRDQSGQVGHGAVFFTGPTLSADAIADRLPGARALPPVARGDVVAAADGGARIIAIIDGTFEREPSVWHKEILWAMARGIHVLGAASMGALRAAELYAFGMEGIGEIFAAYRDGLFDADDEVAVAHASAEHGYRALSDALINMRATLAAAETAGVLSRDEHTLLAGAASGLFYPERTYARVIDGGRRGGVSDSSLDAFAAFVDEHRIDQKRDDALELVERVAQLCAEGPPAKEVDYGFEHTEYFDELLQRCRSQKAIDHVAGRGPGEDSLWDEIRLDPPLYAQVRELAHRLVAARDAADAAGVRFDDEASLLSAAEEFRRRRGLLLGSEFADYVEGEELSREELEGLLQQTALLSWHENRQRPRARSVVVDALRIAGHYRTVLERRQQRNRRMAEAGVDYPSLADAGIDRVELIRWFFEERCGIPVPASLPEYARSALDTSEEELVELLLAAYLFERDREHV